MCVEYLLRLPVPDATDCLGGLAVRMGAVKAAQFLGYLHTDGTRKKVMHANTNAEANTSAT